MHRSYGLQHLRHKQPTRRNRGLPSLVHSAASCCWRNFLFRHAFIYIHFPVLCEPPLYQQREKSGEAAAISFIPTVPHCVFQLLAQTAHVRFHSRKWVHPRLHSKDRTQRFTRRNTGRFGWGWYHYSRSVPHVHQHPRAGYQNGKFCRFWGLVGGAPKKRREPRDSVAHDARRCPAGVAAPLGCVICLQFGDVAVFLLCAQYFLNVRGGGGITTLGAFHTVWKPCVARG